MCKAGFCWVTMRFALLVTTVVCARLVFANLAEEEEEVTGLVAHSESGYVQGRFFAGALRVFRRDAETRPFVVDLHALFFGAGDFRLQAVPVSAPSRRRDLRQAHQAATRSPHVCEVVFFSLLCEVVFD